MKDCRLIGGLKKFRPVLLMVLSCLSFQLTAYHHEELPVDFIDYEANVVPQRGSENKPFLLVFSAQWCHWCHEFHEKSLKDPRVSDFLNKRFVNVFVDVDIQTAAYRKYQATGLPYTVFLNPDGSIYYKYSGTLYADDFLDVIKQVAGDIAAGRSLLQSGVVDLNYEPPNSLESRAIADLDEMFQEELLANFDSRYGGLGKGQKAIHPRAFLYLLNSPDRESRELATQQVAMTMQAAIKEIYDPEEGGFFRYAENRDWGIPHYEKMADLNAGAVLLLNQLHQRTGAPYFKAAADKTLAYLTSTLFDPSVGCFLSFQGADTSYYFLKAQHRKNVEAPPVANKIFVDRLAPTLSYLISSLKISPDDKLRDKVETSLDLLTTMILQGDRIYRYYDLVEKKWFKPAYLKDHASLVETLKTAYAYFGERKYLDAAQVVARESSRIFYSSTAGIFVDTEVGNEEDVEFQMNLNGQLLGLWSGELAEMQKTGAADKILTYFSGMGEILEERVFDAVNWDFAENYVAYLENAQQLMTAAK